MKKIFITGRNATVPSEKSKVHFEEKVMQGAESIKTMEGKFSKITSS